MHSLNERLAARSLNEKDLMNLKGGRGRERASNVNLNPASGSSPSTTPSGTDIMPVELENIINSYVIE